MRCTKIFPKLKSISHLRKLKSGLSKPASQVKKMLLPHIPGFERLLSTKRWMLLSWPMRLKEAFSSNSAADVSILLLQLEQALTKVAQAERPEWAGLPIGFALQIDSWRDAADKTRTFAQLCIVASKFIKMLEPFLTAYQRACTPEGEAVFVPSIGKAYQFIDAYQLVCEFW